MGNIVGSIHGRRTVGQQPWASCSRQCASVHQAVYTVCNLVPCQGIYANAPYVAAIHGSNEQREYCSSGSAVLLIA